MAVEASDGPVTFKSSSASKSNQLYSEMRKSTSHSHDERSYKNTSDVSSSNGQTSSSQNGKVVPSAKASAVESSVGNTKASTSNLKTQRNKDLINVNEENNSTKHLKEDRCEDSEEEDSIPLSSIKMKMNNGNVKKATPDVLKKSYEDSDDDDDDIPLSARLPKNTNLGKSRCNFDDSNKQEMTSMLSAKRSLDKIDSLHSSGKKSKLSDPASSINAKQKTMKCDAKAEEEEEDDDIPISRRRNKLVNKSSSLKKLTNVTKVNKGAAPSFKKKSKLKKSGNKSKHVKSTKLQSSSGDGQKKWTTLVHNGVIFPPPYKPHGVKVLYKGKPVTLTPEQEESSMQNEIFKDNFWNDWRKLLGENHVIQNLKDCDFTPIYDWCQVEKDKKKQMSSEEKKALKEQKMKQEEKYMWVIVDGVKEKVGNFRVEPPGLFIGRGEHPKIGKVKRRIHPSDVSINIGKYAPIPECPIPGESWKEIKHKDTRIWLAKCSSLKGQSDKEKYEKARMLNSYIGNIRAAYTKGFTSKDITKQQIAVATYFIDKLALRAGNEKDDEEADTVGCCTLKVENVTAQGHNKLKFDFLGKDSIKYEYTVEVELPVYNAILKFQKVSAFLSYQINVNAHLKELMPNLTAKVFRTFNASFTLDDMLNKETKDGDVAEKRDVYQHANKQGAIICNHQRSVSKNHSAQISKLNEKIVELQAFLRELKIDLKKARKEKSPLTSSDGKKRNLNPEAIEKKITQTSAKIEKMQRDMHTKEDLKTVALGTSKINYLDPRITVAWCKRHEVPIEKV
ncbi:DNA topoisomerase type I [Medicago truncatula]|uniref:DNA topoisomerase n=1 Tax=Medicago truncatula TaxID=3880 RepID=G7J5B6_MEDTR|nr:DNA topoisomerase type I [Medicago truncatula]